MASLFENNVLATYSLAKYFENCWIHKQTMKFNFNKGTYTGCLSSDKYSKNPRIGT